MTSASATAGPSTSSFFHVLSSSSPATFAVSRDDGLTLASHHVHLSGHWQYGEEDEEEDTYEEVDYSSGTKLATPGQILGSLSTYMRGHGTHLIPSSPQPHHHHHPSQPSQIASSLTGRVILTNRLLSLQPFYTRYSPETGDLVLGKVLNVLPGARRWKISLGSPSLSNLALSAINLPGGIQRRKVSSDELQMRSFFKEGDLLVAEVQGVYNDGSTSLHTRSLRYGKLRNGRLVYVPCRLVRRGRSHFIRLKRRTTTTTGREMEEVDMILGLNGWIWLSAVGAMQGSESSTLKDDLRDESGGASGVGRDIEAGATYSDELKLPSPQSLSTLSTLSSLLHLLSSAYLPISDQSVQLAWDIASDLQDDENEMDGVAQEGQEETVGYWSSVLARIKQELRRRGEIGTSTTTSGRGGGGGGGGIMDDGFASRKMDEDDDF